MSLSSNGITPEVIRDIMPPYCLSPDLLQATFACIPPPPPDASTPWRHARITRLLAEITAQKPADAGQARIAAQILITRELADTFAARALAPDLTIPHMCRLARTAAELQRTAITLDRSLARHQQQPVPFFGTVTEDAVDLAAIDANWCRAADHSGPAPNAAPTHQPPPVAPDAPRAAAARSTPPAAQPDAAPHTADADPRATPPPPTPPVATPPLATPPPPTVSPVPPPNRVATPQQPDRSPDTAAPLTRPAAPGSDWTITRLDEGPGWTREVLRHRSAGKPENGTEPGSAT